MLCLLWAVKLPNERSREVSAITLPQATSGGRMQDASLVVIVEDEPITRAQLEAHFEDTGF